jgi:hypothetical protein
MPTEVSAWLRGQREARGWTRPEMARQLIDAGRARGDRQLPGMDGMCHNIYRWERGGEISERYKLHYCQALGIQPSQFGPGISPNGAAELATATTADESGSRGVAAQLMPYAAPIRGIRSLPPPGTVAYRGIAEPNSGYSVVEREVLMAAHDGSERAEQAEERGIGDATLEQLRADVARLSREYMTGEPFPLFLEMRRVRRRMHDALDRRMWPRDARDLYLLLGCLNDLMAVAAYDLGYPQAAEELIRAGWAYAIAIDHRPLMAQLRQQLAWTVAWQQPHRSREYAASGLEYLPDGPNAAQLHLLNGRAAARLGDVDAARQAITAASEAREREHHDDLLELGGEFVFSRATHHSYAGATLIEIRDAAAEAATELEQATELYAAGPNPGEIYSAQCEMFARTDLATARLRSGALDAAVGALEPVLSLPEQKRTLELPQRLNAVRAELAQPIYHRSAQAQELGERIEEFGLETIGAGLHSLPGAPG